MRHVTREALQGLVGRETGRSRWLTVDQKRIDTFAAATENRHWIHTDPVKAKNGPFGSTVAPGFLTLSLVDELLDEAAVMPEGVEVYLNYGSDKVRYLSPVPAGSRIRAVNILKAVSRTEAGQTLMTNHVVVEVEGSETPALVADILYLTADTN